MRWSRTRFVGWKLSMSYRGSTSSSSRRTSSATKKPPRSDPPRRSKRHISLVVQGKIFLKYIFRRRNEESHEIWHSPRIRGSYRNLWLWQQIRDAQHAQKHYGRNLFRLPSLLYRQNEVRRHHWPR